LPKLRNLVGLSKLELAIQANSHGVNLTEQIINAVETGHGLFCGSQFKAVTAVLAARFELIRSGDL
jgi:hypothetical protein